MDTYFIRHTETINISQVTRQRLWDEQRIAIHYPEHNGEWKEEADNDSLDPADYGGGKARQYMSALQRLGSDGGHVCAEYYGHSDMLIGIVPPNSAITILRGEWGDCQRPAALKSLQLINAKPLRIRDHCIIAAKRPRQGTILRWHAVGDYVANLIEGRVMPLSWEMLSTDQQELACSEFLRLPEVSRFGLPCLKALLMPVGRTLKDVDIIGLAEDGKRIFAQVTFSTLDHAGEKLDKLAPFIDPTSSHVVLFCSCDTPLVRQGIQIIPVQEVFRTLNSLEWGQNFLRGIT